MLVLNRKIGETFTIGNEIEITIVDIRGGDNVRIGITAPRSLSIDRPDAKKPARVTRVPRATVTQRPVAS